MFSYEAGLIVALVLWAWSAASLIISLNSTLERNLNRIGQRLSWITRAPKPMDADDRAGVTMGKVWKFLFIVGIGLPFVLLSWAYVGYSAAVWLYQWTKNFGEPQAIKEYRWKMRNIDMTLDQIAKEMLKVSGDDTETFEQFRDRLGSV